MTDTPYTPPVDKLLTLGEADLLIVEEWPDYLALGIGPEHIPDLLRMANDEELNNAESDSLEIWAPVHAVRVLGQLRDESTIEPLLKLLTVYEDEGWVHEEMPGVFELIGPAAIPALSAYLADASHNSQARSSASTALSTIAERYPEHRTASIEAIARTLERFEENDPELNAFIIGDLAQIKAVEAVPLIEKAFEAERVDDFIIDLDYTLVRMGLKEAEEMPPLSFEELLRSFPLPPTHKYEPSDFKIIGQELSDDENAPIVDSLPVKASKPTREFKPIKFSRNKPKKKKKKRH